MHNRYGIVQNRATLHWKDGKQNSKVVISSHGATAYNFKPIPKIEIDLHFAAKGNRSTHGKVSSIRSMGTNDFDTEPSGTSQVDQHILTWYENDRAEEIDECLMNGFDVVTIEPNWKVTLGGVLSELAKLQRYDEVFGLFCRVPHGQRMVKVLPTLEMPHL